MAVNGDVYVGSFTGNIYRYVGGVMAGRVLLTTLGSSNPSLAFNNDTTDGYPGRCSDRDTEPGSCLCNGGSQKFRCILFAAGEHY